VGDQRGEASILMVPLILAVLLLIGAVVFGGWAYSGRQDYKNNVDAKIAVATKNARADEDVIKDKEHAELDKQPLKTYKGPDQYGAVLVSYPKTWSGYVIDSGSGTSSMPLDGYFHPNVVPNTGDRSAAFALRVQVANQPYSQVLASFSNDVTSKKVTVTPYAFPRVPKVIGVRIEGTIDSGRKLTGVLILVPLRDKTLRVSTESPLYYADFNNLILPNITFSP
jgi:hypothetical protein